MEITRPGGALSLAGRVGSFLLVTAVCLPLLRADQSIYTDSLQNGWQNWGWATINYNNSSPVHSGTYSISVTINSTSTNYEAIYIAHPAFDSSPFTNLVFWINGGPTGGQQLKVQGHAGTVAQSAVSIPDLQSNTWQQITVSLSALGCANRPDMDGFWIQDRAGRPWPTFYVDDISLISGTAPPVTNTPVTIAIDAQRNRRPISPLIYGSAFATSNQLADLNFTLNRSGGNAETRYNWLINAHNRAADWYFESIADSPATPAAAADDFVATSKSAGAEPLLTIPMIGWAPSVGPSRGKLSSYSIAKYGPQTGSDSQYMPDAGNGVGTNAATHTSWLITSNNPTDANFQTNSTFQLAFVQHLTNRWGTAASNGVHYYLMDNEHSIWHSTHRDIHPVGATMQEIRDRFFDYAGTVKSIDPAALVLAPEEWGWSGYFYSGYDQQYGGQHGWSSLPDRATNGGWDYLPWLLDQFRQQAATNHLRLLDYFTVHWYPQGGESGNDTSTSTQLLRNRSTRSLWDTNYVDASWINSVVQLVPRLKNWAATYYPGTKVGITEYNWGAEASINGATAQADVLGIFGREGLDLATRWVTPDPSTPTYKAMKLFRNYDGNKSAFGETSVSAVVPNPDTVSAFAATRASDSALTLVAINKQLSASALATITITNWQVGSTGQVWQLTASNAIARLADVSFNGNSFTNTLPPQSMTMFVLGAAATPPPPHLRAGTWSAPSSFDLWLDGVAGQRYALDTSSNLLSWAPVSTNVLTSNSWHIILSNSPAGSVFFRGRWAP